MAEAEGARQSEECVLVVVLGDQAGAEVVVPAGGEALVGADAGVALRLQDDGVAGTHLRVHYEGGESILFQALSGRTVKVNGEKKKKGLLSAGDQLALGRTTLRVSIRRRLGGPERTPPSGAMVKAEDHRGTTSSERDAERARPRNEAIEGSRGQTPGRPRPASEAPRKPPPLALQHVWFELSRDESWRSMAIVPTDPETSSMAVVRGFAEMAALNPHARVLVVDATLGGGQSDDGALLDNLASSIKREDGSRYDTLNTSGLGMNDAELAHIYVPQLLEYIASGSGRYNRVLLGLGFLLNQATAIPIARAVERVVLCVGEGHSKIPDIRRTVDIVGKERVVGSIVAKEG